MTLGPVPASRRDEAAEGYISVQLWTLHARHACMWVAAGMHTHRWYDACFKHSVYAVCWLLWPSGLPAY